MRHKEDNYADISEILIKPDGIGGDELWVKYQDSPNRWTLLNARAALEIRDRLLAEPGNAFERLATWSSDQLLKQETPRGYANTVRLVGRVVGPPGLTYLADEPCCTFVINTTEDATDEGIIEQIERPWHRVVARGMLAEVCDSLLSMDALVQINGHLLSRWKVVDLDTYTEEFATEIIIDDIAILDQIVFWRRIQ